MSRHGIPTMIAIIVATLVASACSGTASGPPGASQGAASTPAAAASSPVAQGSGSGGAEGSPTSGGGGASLVAAAAAVKDACEIMPMDLAATIVPNASEPQKETFANPKCTISNGISVLEVTIGAYDAVDPLVPNEPVAGLGSAAYLQKQTVDNAYLKIILDPNGGAIYVEVAGHDGKDHGDDAIAVARRILEALQ